MLHLKHNWNYKANDFCYKNKLIKWLHFAMLLITKLINRICTEVNISVTLFISKTQKQITMFILGMREQLQLLVNLVNVIFGHIFEECAIFAIRLIFIAAKDCILSTQFLVWKKWLEQTFVFVNNTNPADKKLFLMFAWKRFHTGCIWNKLRSSNFSPNLIIKLIKISSKSEKVYICVSVR